MMKRRSLPQWEGHSSQKGSVNQDPECEMHDLQIPRLEVSVWVRNPFREASGGQGRGAGGQETEV